MAKAKTPPKHAPPARPAVPTHYDKYLATMQAIYCDPIDLIELLRARTILRGDGSTGPMTFAEIAEIVTALAGKHAQSHAITPVTITFETVRRWWRYFHPDEPTRRPRGAKPDDKAMTLAELELAHPSTAAAVREELGL
jgi:hypothetical protein